MVYVSYYELYAIYEPAEGGYYYEGCRLINSEKMSLRKAKQNILNIWEEAKNDPCETYEKCNNYNPNNYNKLPSFQIYTHGKYIGDGCFYCIERKKGIHNKGYQPYC